MKEYTFITENETIILVKAFNRKEALAILNLILSIPYIKQ